MDTYETVADCRTTGTSLQRLMPVATGKQHNATIGAALSDAHHGTHVSSQVTRLGPLVWWVVQLNSPNSTTGLTQTVRRNRAVGRVRHHM